MIKLKIGQTQIKLYYHYHNIVVKCYKLNNISYIEWNEIYFGSLAYDQLGRKIVYIYNIAWNTTSML